MPASSLLTRSRAMPHCLLGDPTSSSEAPGFLCMKHLRATTSP